MVAVYCHFPDSPLDWAAAGIESTAPVAKQRAVTAPLQEPVIFIVNLVVVEGGGADADAIGLSRVGQGVGIIT